MSASMPKHLQDLLLTLGVLCALASITILVMWAFWYLVFFIVSRNKPSREIVAAGGTVPDQKIAAVSGSRRVESVFNLGLIVVGTVMYVIGMSIVALKWEKMAAWPVTARIAFISLAVLASLIIGERIKVQARDKKGAKFLADNLDRALLINHCGINILWPLIGLSAMAEEKADNSGYVTIPWNKLYRVNLMRRVSAITRLLIPGIVSSKYMIYTTDRVLPYVVSAKYFDLAAEEQLIKAIQRHFSGPISLGKIGIEKSIQ